MRRVPVRASWWHEGFSACATACTALLCAAGLVGCVVGPDFQPPAPPGGYRYTPDPQPAVAPPGAAAERDIPAEWWAVFASPEIDALVRRALAQSPTLDIARARLTQAQELRSARAGVAASPAIDATFGAVRQRIDPATFGFPQAPNPGPFNVFSLGAQASYDFDLFGGTRRELEALAAEVDVRGFEFEAARLTLASNVVATAIRSAALAAQIDIVERILAAQRLQLDIAEARLAAGGVSRLDVQNQRARLAQADTVLPPLRAQRDQAAHLLAVLVGDPPAAAALPGVRFAALKAPDALPQRLPSELVRQRPDIRVSEALLHKASAQVGVATADLYPKFVVSGSFSSSQLDLADVLGNGINIWNIGANLLQPLLRGGELRARQRAAVAAYDQAAAAYRQAVLQGLQNVADVLRALEADAGSVAARAEGAARADDAYRITRGRYEAGGVSQLALLDAERQRAQADLDLLQAQANRLADVAALFQALGGGWVTWPSAPATAAALGE